MTELNVMALAIAMRAITVIACVVGAVHLAQQEKSGWGWLIFLAVICASTSYRYTND